MMHSNWMMDGYSRGGMWHGMNGGFDGFGPVSLLTISVFSVFAVLALIWAIGIKGYSLWTAAKRGDKWWFIALLIINTFGLLEVIYLIFFAKIGVKDKLNKVSNSVAAATSGSSNATHGHAAHAHTHSHEMGSDKKTEENK